MTENCLYACGSNGNYQLGLGHDEDLNTLTKVSFEDPDDSRKLHRILKIATGGNHTLVLFDDGQVWAAGDNKYGQCGILPTSESLQKIFVFRKIGEPAAGIRWVNMACGWEFSVLINDKNELYSCGFGSKGELGLGQKISKSYSKDQLAPHDSSIVTSMKKVSFEVEAKIIDIQASLNHAVAVLENGLVYGWGVNKNLKLSLLLPKIVWSPVKLEVPWEDRDDLRVVLGRDYTFFYTTDDVQLRGNAPKIQEDLSQLKGYLEKWKIKYTQAMWSSVHVQLQNDKEIKIVSLGNNSHGQKFQWTNQERINMKAFKSFKAGSEHGLILNENNRVYAWGWGEHGNCGMQRFKAQDDVTFDKLNEIFHSDSEMVTLISGGCATSFVVTSRQPNSE